MNAGRQHLVVALSVSALVHGVGIGMLAGKRGGVPGVRESRPLELELRWLEHEKSPSSAGVPASARPTRGAAQPSRAEGPKENSVGSVQPNEAVPPEGAVEPRRLRLGPELFESIGLAPAQEAPRGRTLHPSDMPSIEEQLVEEQAVVGARVDGFVGSGIRAARARNGLPAHEVSLLGEALREATAVVPKLIDTDDPREVVGAFKESWLAGAGRYGATGAPYAEPEGRWEAAERPGAVAEAASRGGAAAMEFQSLLYAGARLQEFGDGRAGVELYALVEVKQSSGGAFDSVTLVRASGLRPFDKWVTERATAVASSFSFDAGSARPLRSVWRFDGIMKFRRKISPKEMNGRALIGIAAMTALSMLSSLGNDGKPRVSPLVGRFDPVTGEIDMVDFTNPTYECKVSLVESD